MVQERRLGQGVAGIINDVMALYFHVFRRFCSLYFIS